MIRILSLALLLTLASPILAATEPEDDEDRWYDIEIIVFAQPSAENSLSAETWPDEPEAPALDQAIELAPAADALPIKETASRSRAPAPPRLPFQHIDGADLRLNALVRKLAASQTYTPILHTAWRQPVVEGERALPVHISSGDRTPPAGSPAPQEGPAAPPAQEPLQESEGSGQAPAVPATIDGTVLVSRNRYLHLETDLLYHRSETAETGLFGLLKPDKPAPTVFRLSQSRRVGSGELYYFDHPLFGLIALITPYPDEQAQGAKGN